MAVSKRLRYEIFRRDGHACKYCGARAPQVPLTIDHIVPKTLGGTDAPENLAAACIDCNAGKSSSRPDAELVLDVAAAQEDWGSSSRVYREAVVLLYGSLPGFDFAAERARLTERFDRLHADDGEDESGTLIEYPWPDELRAFAASIEELADLREWVNYIIGLLSTGLDHRRWQGLVEASIRSHENAGEELAEDCVRRYAVVLALRDYIRSGSPVLAQP